MTRLLSLVPGWLWAVVVLLLAAYALGATHTISGLRSDALKTAQQLGELEAERDDARDAASMCSDAVEDLRARADKRAADARPVQAAAQQAAGQRQAAAQLILSTPAAVQRDDCASARVRIDSWLTGRGQ